MQSTSINHPRDRDAAPLVPEWPTAMDGFRNDHVAHKPSVVGRMFRAFARFSIAVLIGVCATLAWQSYGDEAREMLSTQVPSLRWLSVSNTTAALPQPAPVPPAAAAPAVITAPELAQIEPMGRDITAMRAALEQLAAKQEQITQTIATLQAVEQEIKRKILSAPLSQAGLIPPRKSPKSSAQSSSGQSPPGPPPSSAAQSASQSRPGSP